MLYVAGDVQPDAVFALADRISVMVYGCVIATGRPEAVRANPATRDLPIVVMSAKFTLLNTRDHDVQGYVRKPLDAMAMLDTLEAVLRQGT